MFRIQLHVGSGLGPDTDVDADVLLAVGTLPRALQHGDGAAEMIPGRALRAREVSLAPENRLVATWTLDLVGGSLLSGSLEQSLRGLGPQDVHRLPTEFGLHVALLSEAAIGINLLSTPVVVDHLLALS